MNGDRQRITLIVALTGLAFGAWWFWTRDLYKYRGKTVAQWFAEVDWTPPSVDSMTGFPSGPEDPAKRAFQEMGTNAAPFLANQITRNRDTFLEKWIHRLPQRRPVTENEMAMRAASLLRSLEMPSDMGTNLLKSALTSSNINQNWPARWALGLDQ